MLILEGSLSDKVANQPKEIGSVIMEDGFGGITDIEVGPDGYLYVLSLSQTNPQHSTKCDASIPNIECCKYNDPIKGSLFKIIPVEASS